MPHTEKKAKVLKTASLILGVIGLVCLLFSTPVSDALSFLLGKGDSAELVVVGLGILSVLVCLYLQTEAKKTEKTP